MYCVKCGSSLPTGHAFCARCGTPVDSSPPSPEPSEPALPDDAPRSKLAVTALVLSLVPVCLNLVGLVLGIVVLSKIKDWRMRGRGLALASVIVGAVWLAATPVVGMLAAVAIPNFIKFKAKAQQAEAKANLRSLATAARLFESEHGRPAETLAELAFSPSSGRRYAYFFRDEALQPDLAGPFARPTLPDATVEHLALAAGNLDSDEPLDLWGLKADGEVVLLFDDVTDSFAP